MIKVFAGEDTFESYTKAKSEFNKISKSMDSKILNADEISVDEFLVEIEGVGLFSSEKVIFAKRFFKNKKLVELLTDGFERIDQFELIIWEDSKPDGRSKLVKLLKKNGRITEFNKPKDWQIEKWMDGLIKVMKINLSRNQIGKLIEITEANKWLIYSDLKKIKIYFEKNNSNKISDEEFTVLISGGVNGDIWKLTDYFGEKKFNLAFEEIKKLLFFEDNVQYILAMLAREIDLLLKVKEAEEKNLDKKSLKIHPFVLQKTIKKSQNFTKQEISSWMKKLLTLDLKIRQGKIKGDLGMYQLFYKH